MKSRVWTALSLCHTRHTQPAAKAQSCSRPGPIAGRRTCFSGGHDLSHLSQPYCLFSCKNGFESLIVQVGSKVLEREFPYRSGGLPGVFLSDLSQPFFRTDRRSHSTGELPGGNRNRTAGRNSRLVGPERFRVTIRRTCGVHRLRRQAARSAK